MAPASRVLRRRIAVASAAAALLGGLVGCTAKDVIKSDPMVSLTSSAPSSTPKPTPAPAPVVWPLTGVPSGKVAPTPPSR